MRPFVSTLVAGALIAFPALAPAQRNRIQIYGSGGFGLTSAYAHLYDPATVITFSGRITGITVASPISGVGNSVRLVVKTKNGGSSLVELGPQWYVNNERVKLHLRDRVTVVGSKIMLDGRGSIMASRVFKGRQALVLRDTTGRPYWNAAALSVMPVGLSTQGTSAQEMVTPQPVVQEPAVRQVRLTPYDSTKIVFSYPTTLNGTLTDFEVNNGEVFANLNTGMGVNHTVYLGPLWYLERQDVTLNPGDIVSMNVLTPIPNPSHMTYAQRITINGTTLVLRDDTGQMAWQPFIPTTVVTPP